MKDCTGTPQMPHDKITHIESNHQCPLCVALKILERYKSDTERMTRVIKKFCSKYLNITKEIDK